MNNFNIDTSTFRLAERKEAVINEMFSINNHIIAYRSAEIEEVLI